MSRNLRFITLGLKVLSQSARISDTTYSDNNLEDIELVLEHTQVTNRNGVSLHYLRVGLKLRPLRPDLEGTADG
jgi:hypothetical protein